MLRLGGHRGAALKGCKLVRISIKTPARVCLVDVTKDVGSAVGESEPQDGVCHVWCPHTTAAITLNEGADPDVGEDLKGAFERLVPRMPFSHAEGNSPAHFLSSLLGQHLCLPVEKGKPILGTWQAIFLCEFDGPRTRNLLVKFVPDRLAGPTSNGDPHEAESS
jgi:secondary thiamine-phosphate synthase enzyme